MECSLLNPDYCFLPYILHPERSGVRLLPRHSAGNGVCFREAQQTRQKRKGANMRMQSLCAILMICPVWACSPAAEIQPKEAPMKTLQVHPNGRFLCWQDGAPFFYLGDTAWELFHRLNREEADLYLGDRAAKGFTVIQAVVLAELNGLTDPNPYGHTPLENLDPRRPSEAYFQHVDYIVNKAESLGLHIGMLPTWGDKWNRKWGAGPEIFTPENAEAYGEFLGRRYRERAIIWILGGDRPVENDNHRAIIRAMAAGLRKGDGGRHLMTLHPCGQQHSAQYFHSEEWLNFNMCQTGHTFNRDNYRSIALDYARQPVKPCLDGEPGYEDHPSGFKAENGYMDDAQTRRFAYWALFAGALGHTYGCHDIWQFWQEGRKAKTAARTPWKEALKLPGSAQVGYARALLESRPFFTRVPAQALLIKGPPPGPDYVAVTSDKDAQGKATYILAYLPKPSEIVLNTSVIADKNLRVCWFDPRKGQAHKADQVPNTGEFHAPVPPDQGDWVLVIDAASSDYPPPGKAGAKSSSP